MIFPENRYPLFRCSSLDENQSYVPSIANNSAMRQSGDTRLAVRRNDAEVLLIKMVNDAEFRAPNSTQ
jgi:hypothetical protein